MKRFINQIKYNKLYKILLYFDIKTDKELVNEVVRMDPTISELHEKAELARLNTEEGKEEGIKEIGLNLKTKGYSLEEIKEITGLSIKRIESLSENTK
jgi:predicted transposase YdaD